MNYFIIGQIVNTHGIKGEMKIYPYTDDIDNLLNQTKLYINENFKEYLEVQSSKSHKGMIIIKCKNVDNVDEAEKLKNKYIYIKKSELEELEEDTYYIEDLIGMDVFLEDSDELIGKVDYVWNTGANDVYEVKLNSGKNIFIPAIHQVIKNIDIHNKKIIVHMMEGLM